MAEQVNKEDKNMSTSVGVQELWDVREPPLWKQLDEAVWRVWVEKGRAQGRRNSAARLMAVKWISVTALVVVAGLWSHVAAPYDVVARFIVAAGAMVMMFHAIHGGHYALAAVFAVVALLYNPVAPVFSFSGDWPRAVVLASAIPFVASLTAGNMRGKHNA
jgi:hypothetical protein